MNIPEEILQTEHIPEDKKDNTFSILIFIALMSICIIVIVFILFSLFGIVIFSFVNIKSIQDYESYNKRISKLEENIIKYNTSCDCKINETIYFELSKLKENIMKLNTSCDKYILNETIYFELNKLKENIDNLNKNIHNNDIQLSIKTTCIINLNNNCEIQFSNVIPNNTVGIVLIDSEFWSFGNGLKINSIPLVNSYHNDHIYTISLYTLVYSELPIGYKVGRLLILG